MCEAFKDERGRLQFSFRDLVLFRNTRVLLDSGVSMRKILALYRRLDARLQHRRRLSSLSLSTEGGAFLWQENGRIWNAETGQAQLDFRPPQQAPLADPANAEAVREPDKLIEDWAEEEVDDWCAIGLYLEDRDRPLEAAYAYVEAIKRQPDHVNAMVNLGRLHHLHNNVWVARALYERAVSVQPDHPEALYNLGTVYDEAGDLDKAIEYYLQAPEVADAHYNLSLIYSSRGKDLAAHTHRRMYDDLERTER